MAMPVKINRRSDMRYYIADNHFFHRALNTKMDKRGFKSVEEMNDYMIQQWNLKVKKNDEVILLGDFSWGSWKDTKSVLDQLKGKKYLIKGIMIGLLKIKNSMRLILNGSGIMKN